MPYITVRQAQKAYQVTFEDILLGRTPCFNGNTARKDGGTVTYYVDSEKTIEKYSRTINIQQLILVLEMYISAHSGLFEVYRRSLYHSFDIPKRSGGFRRIDAPTPELMEALRQLKVIFEDRFNALHHTSAFAYVKNRCPVDSIKKHQQNKSKWFLKTDFSDFFGSTTEDFLWKMITMVFPFSEIAKSDRGKTALRKVLGLCFLNGGLPQGTPISPLLTNLMMIPIDHKLTNDLVKKGFVYSRYADDILISHREDFDFHSICDYIEQVLTSFDAPFRIKQTKTRYGSSSGRNWNLGVMLNKDNEITIGRRNKEYLKAACDNYLRDKKNGVCWEPRDIQTLRGKISYYESVERKYIDGFIDWFNKKNNVNLKKMLRDDLK